MSDAGGTGGGRRRLAVDRGGDPENRLPRAEPEALAREADEKVLVLVLVLATVQHVPKATKDKGRVLVLLVRPVIFIREEEKAFGNNPKP